MSRCLKTSIYHFYVAYNRKIFGGQLVQKQNKNQTKNISADRYILKSSGKIVSWGRRVTQIDLI